MEIAALTAAVIGSVELVNRLFDKDYRGASKIGVAALVGALLAPQVLVAGVALTWFGSLVLGLGASGVVTTVSKIGNN